MTSKRKRRLSAIAIAAVLSLRTGIAAADGARPRVWATDDGVRVRRDEIGSPRSRGEGNPIWRPGEPLRLATLRDEVVAIQVLIEGGDDPLSDVTVEISPFEPAAGSDPSGGAVPRVSRFVEHYVEVRARSRNSARPAESLGWSPGARPPDADVLGWMPDALIPVELAPPWAPYPLHVEPHQSGAVWIDLTTPPDARPGAWHARLSVTSPVLGRLASIEVLLDVRGARLPYRPVSFFAYYDPERALSRIGDVRGAERQLWQLLHAHHLDALGTLLSPEDADALRAAHDGSLFTAASGYDGPGIGVPPALAAIGVYGQLREASPERVRRVEAIAARIPAAIDDVVLYAIDEQCESPRGPEWRKALAASSVRGRVLAAHTCDEDPSGQDVDVVIMPARAFDEAQARAARASGKVLWVYNGVLPRSGVMHLDAPLSGLLVDGWIAASRPVGRWFLWETTFWHDTNGGGHGPIDPFVTPENFHNQDGDASLGDGLLVYPGSQAPPFAAHSLGFTGVVPSIRLKSLRRGIQDAGYIALARAAAPQAADAVVARTLPAVLDEVDEDARTPWPLDGGPFAAARSALRDLIPATSALDRQAVERALDGGRNGRTPARPRAGRWRLRTIAGVAAALVLVAGLAYARARRRARPVGGLGGRARSDPDP